LLSILEDRLWKMESEVGNEVGGEAMSNVRHPKTSGKTGADAPIGDELRELWMASACRGAFGEDFEGHAGVDDVRTREYFDTGSAEHVLGRGREEI
jgi:hypothetical protein